MKKINLLFTLLISCLFCFDNTLSAGNTSILKEDSNCKVKELNGSNIADVCDSEAFIDSASLINNKSVNSAESSNEIKLKTKPQSDASTGYKQMAGMTIGVGPVLSGAFVSSIFTTTAEYRYFLLNERLSVGAQIGLVNYSSKFVKISSFLILPSAEYYFSTDKWKPYAGLQLGGAVGDANAFVLSPHGGCMYALNERIILDAGLRFPIAIVSDTYINQITSMSFNFGAHFKF